VQLQVERGHDAEVATAAAQPPEELGVLVGRRLHHATVGRHHFRTDQVVAGESELPLEPAAAASQREPGDARVGHATAGDREAVLLRRGVELTPVEARLGAHRARVRIDRDALHAAHVDHQTVVDHGRTGHAMTTAVHRQPHVLRARVLDRGDDVVGGAAHRDQRRAAVDHAVEDGARLVVAVVTRPQKLAAESGNPQRGRACGHRPPSDRRACSVEDLS
jgi:hypothetical protein